VLVVIGLADQTMLPLVAEPLALEVLDEPGVLDVPGVLEELLLHAAAVSATTTPTAAASADRRLPRSVGTIFMTPNPSVLGMLLLLRVRTWLSGVHKGSACPGCANRPG
jgi:hypothetical protein